MAFLSPHLVPAVQLFQYEYSQSEHIVGNDQHNGPQRDIFGNEVTDDPDLNGFVLSWKSCYRGNENDLAGCYGSRMISMGMTTISGCECCRNGVKRLKGVLN